MRQQRGDKARTSIMSTASVLMSPVYRICHQGTPPASMALTLPGTDRTPCTSCATNYTQRSVLSTCASSEELGQSMAQRIPLLVLNGA